MLEANVVDRLQDISERLLEHLQDHTKFLREEFRNKNNMINCLLEQLSKRDDTIFSYENQVCNLTILTWKKNLCFAEFSTKFIKIKGWLLLAFFIWLHNTLSSFNSITVSTDVWKTCSSNGQSKWMVASFSNFYGKTWVGFCLIRKCFF